MALLLGSCKNQNISETLTQGISGKVILLEGDFMPGPGKDLESKMKPVSRSILVYPLIKDNSKGPFYSLNNQKPLYTTNSNESGFFYINLPTGKYSILVKEEKGLFANMTDGTFINPVQVYKDSVSQIVIRIDHEAFY